MSMSKRSVLLEAASFIDEEANCLFESHRNSRTGDIEDEQIAGKYRRELWLASKLRSYAGNKKSTRSKAIG